MFLSKIKYPQRVAFCVLLWLLPGFLPAQNTAKTGRCGDKSTPADWEAYRQSVQAMRTEPLAERGAALNLYVGVQFHILHNEDGEGMTEAQVVQELAYANAKYAPADIQFFQCDPPHIIESDDWFNETFELDDPSGCGQTTPEYELTGLYNVPNVINIYWVNTDGWNWAYYPSALASSCADWIIMDQDDAGKPALLAHELGHYFNLRHTFGNFNENVTRSFINPCFNCDTDGDLFCDTPADHHDRDSGGDWSGCDPTDEYDDCGVLLTPDGLNIMSYSFCSGDDKYFSAEQRAMLRYSLSHQRAYLSCPSSCLEDRVIAGTHQYFYTYRAEETISSTAELADGVAVRYEAEEISLLPGFSAPAGTTFQARPLPCAAFTPPPSTEVRTAPPPAWSARIVPTAVQESAALWLDLPSETDVSAFCVTADGRVMPAFFSDRALPPGTHRVELALRDWPPGVYRIVVKTPAEQAVVPFVKL